MSSPKANTRKLKFFIASVALLLMFVAAFFLIREAQQKLLCIEITVNWSAEGDLYLKPAMEKFNEAYSGGRDPLTGQPLDATQRSICVTGGQKSAGKVMEDLINAAQSLNQAVGPTIWVPSASHWLVLANQRTGRSDLFDVTNSPATANAPVVIAIWESRLKALQQAYPGQEIGWRHLLEVMTNPKGWEAYGINGRRTVYYGHTDPMNSPTGLSTLIAEYYASARKAGIDASRLTLNMVKNEDVRLGVRSIEQMIKHYAPRTTEFKEYIAQGPDYVDMVALEENDLIYINLGKTQYKPPERLVALYPSEGTFWHEHPFAVANASWVTPEQRKAAEKFREYILSVPIQQLVLSSGFRPANSDVALGYPIVPDLGVDPTQPRTVLHLPEPPVLQAIQESWSYVKKRADIWLVIDISGSMNDDTKIDKAREAALLFLDKIDAQNRVGLIVFNENVTVQVAINTVETNKVTLKQQIKALRAEGGTALFDAIRGGIGQLQKSQGDSMRALVLLSDGCDTQSVNNNPNDILSLLNDSHATNSNPIHIFPIAYGKDACGGVLNAIADASKTKMKEGKPSNIQEIMDILSHLW